MRNGVFTWFLRFPKEGCNLTSYKGKFLGLCGETSRHHITKIKVTLLCDWPSGYLLPPDMRPQGHNIQPTGFSPVSEIGTWHSGGSLPNV